MTHVTFWGVYDWLTFLDGGDFMFGVLHEIIKK